MQYILGQELILDTECYTLERAGQAVPLRPKVFQLLWCLVEHRPRVLTRAALSEAIWDGECRTDSAMNAAMHITRRLLGDSGRAQRFIRTRPGYGYQFVASVQVRTAGGA